MPVRTTNIELKGDRYKSRNLYLAHAARLLEDFRKNSSFQELSINSMTQNFIDKDTGKLVGNIYIQSVYGAEKIIVTTPPTIEKPIKREEYLKYDFIELIVPIIRSSDNAHWLACLSGKFDGPYVHFKNIFNISDDVFYTFAQEDEYHLKLISKGDTQLNNSVEPPELYLVSPTGETPDEDGYHPEEYEFVQNASSGSEYSYTGESIWICSGINLGGYKDSFRGTQYSNTTQKLYIFGNILDNIDYELNSNFNLERAWVVCSTSTEPPPTTEADVITACSGRDYSWITEEIFFGYDDLTGLEYEYGIKLTEGSSDSPWSGSYSVKAERNNVNNSVVCFRTTTTSTTVITSLPWDPCTGGSINTNTENSATYQDFIMVDGTQYPLRDKTAESLPRYFQRDMKYYNTDRSIATTALVATNKGNIDTNYERWLYCYVGPNSNNGLHITEFFPESGNIYHKIPNVPGLDEDVLFNGKIFMGLIRYKVERKTTF